MRTTTGTTAIGATWMMATTLLVLSLPISAQSPASAPEVPLGITPTGAPSPGLDCFSYLLNMSDCLTFVEKDSNLTKPDKGCCPELAGLIESQPICLCQFLENPGSVGIEINVSKALKLPDVCKVSTPPVSLCAALGVPFGAPTASEAGASPEGLASSPAPIANYHNGVRSTGASIITFLVCLTAVGFFTFF